MRTEEMGGWWKVCSKKMGIPPRIPWKVSPMMGLKGFCTLGKHEFMKRNDRTTYFICSTRLVVLTASAIK